MRKKHVLEAQCYKTELEAVVDIGHERHVAGMMTCVLHPPAELSPNPDHGVRGSSPCGGVSVRAAGLLSGIFVESEEMRGFAWFHFPPPVRNRPSPSPCPGTVGRQLVRWAVVQGAAALMPNTLASSQEGDMFCCTHIP